jgi:hypothetical protein
MSQNRRFELGTWIPAAFCFFLSLMQVTIAGDGVSPVLISFLPMCFVFVAIMNIALHRRIAALEAKARAPVGPPSAGN